MLEGEVDTVAPTATAATAAGMRRSEMHRQQAAVVLRAMLQELPARSPGGLRIPAIPAVPPGIVDLDRLMHHLAGENPLATTTQEPDRNVAGRVPGRRHDPDAITDLARPVDHQVLSG